MSRLFNLLFLLMPLGVLSGTPVEWTSHWIMHPEVEPQSHAVVHFRKTFNLDNKPDSFIIHVSADNHYRLFVNGQYILRGPARGDLEHWFYETVDIATHLNQGENVIAAEVVNWGPKRSFSFISQMTSFILQGGSKAEEMVNTHGGSWKCLHNRAHYPKIVDWMTDRSTIDFGLYVGNPTDSIRGDEYPWGWETPGYDDSGWVPAKWADVAGGRETQHAGGILFSGGKLLVPRRVPLLKETAMPFTRIRSTIGLADGNSYIDDMGSLVIPSNEYVIILIDQAHLTMGYPEMIVSGGKDAIIQAMYAENLIVDHKSPKGNRNEIDGKYMVGLKDVFVSDGGEDRLFKPSYIRTFRYIQLDIETFDEPLVIENYYHVECRAPLELNASFSAGNELTDWIMDAGWRSVSLCAQDYLLSDAYYEQMQYTGDSRVHNLTLLTLSGDDRLTRNSLVQFDQSRIPEGLTFACYPNAFHLIIPSYSLIWIDQVHDYMLWKDDREFISQFEMGIKSVLHWFEQKMQPNGLIGPMDWWGALAWPRHYKNGESPTIYEGNNTLYTLHYAYTLRHAAGIFSYLGNRVQAREYIMRANQIIRAVNRQCKNEGGFYTESPGSEQISQITNIMAILSGAVKGKEARSLMEKLLEPKDWFGQVDLFLHVYLFEAMNLTGFGEQFHSELSEWQLMKDRGLTTFVEVPLEWGEENQRSECHPWSSSPNYFFFRTVCGIRPLEAGHKKVEIAPAIGEYKTLNAVYPHHLGYIEIDLEKTSTALKGSVSIPDGMEATFVWNGKRIRLKPGRQQIEY
jgi:alpha-L-rhamnosidase